MRYPHTLLTLNQNLSTVVTKQRELVKYVAIENTFQNFQMGPMQHLDREQGDMYPQYFWSARF